MEQNHIESYFALQIAFLTMKERCKQLETRLVAVEEENMCLRQLCEKDNSLTMTKIHEDEENNIIRSQQEKIEELKKQKSQLVHHLFMVSSENGQLWKRLTRLTQANKSLGNQLTKISDTLKQHPSTEVPNALKYSPEEIEKVFKDNKMDKYILFDNKDNEYSLPEISLRLINSIMLEKSELEQQYAEINELQTNTEMNLKNIGFTYPEDIDTDSFEQLKYHDSRLMHIKEVLLNQQQKLRSVLQNLKKMKKNETCNNCKNSIEKLMCQTGTQFDSCCSLKENESTQTSLPAANLVLDNTNQISENENICPLCGIVYQRTCPIDLFHEHIVNHFTKEVDNSKYFNVN